MRRGWHASRSIDRLVVLCSYLLLLQQPRPLLGPTPAGPCRCAQWSQRRRQEGRGRGGHRHDGRDEELHRPVAVDGFSWSCESCLETDVSEVETINERTQGDKFIVDVSTMHSIEDHLDPTKTTGKCVVWSDAARW